MSAPAGKPVVQGEMAPEIEVFDFTPENLEQVKVILSKFPEPRKQSAVLRLLRG